jgi:hypothetical protein
VGGVAALETAQIEAIEEVEWEDLMPECLWKFRVKDFGPLTVAIDSHGTSLYREVEATASERLERLYDRLLAFRRAARRGIVHGRWPTCASATAPSEAGTTNGLRVSQPRSTAEPLTRPRRKRANGINSTSSSTARSSSRRSAKAAGPSRPRS